MTPLELIFDHVQCHHDGKPFFPLVQEYPDPICDWSHAVTIRLPARQSDDLDWSEPLKLARDLLSKNKWILWEFDFGLAEGNLDLEDQTRFYTFSLAIDEFKAKVWPEFMVHTFGVSLYKGPADFASRINPLHFEEWLSELPFQLPFHRELYCTELFAQYLHRLLSFFPDTVNSFVFLDLSNAASLSQTALIYSKKRFEHVHLAIKGSDLPIPGLRWEQSGSLGGWVGMGDKRGFMGSVPTLAVCLPQDGACDADLMDRLESLLQTLIQSGEPFRLICEERLTEEWNEVDLLVVFSDRISPQGKRKLQGFYAAGGETVDAAERAEAATPS